jgi:gliding motility-associated-like protein
MKKIYTNYLTGLIISVFSFSCFAQITPNGNSGSSITSYTNGAANDPIYIWCADGLSNNTASLTANAPSGTGPFTYNWFFHDQSNFSWSPYFTETGISSTVSNLPSDGYRVQIYDAGSNLVGCYIAWVWNMNSDVTANNTPTACNGSNLSGAVSVNGTFTYYNPPPPESLINSSTQITVCFSATHTWVSDLAFYLVGPAACGSPTILLSPNPGAIGQGTVCNSGDNVNNLCFTTSPAANLNVCDPAPSTLSGTYSSYGPSNTPINWSPLFGCNAAEGGWRVQIYDCISLDVGSLTNATITFSNLTSICGSPTSISYTSGAINSAINDNSCSAATASIFQVPVSPNLTTPITINASVSYLWTADQAVTIPGASSSLTPSVTNIPNGTTNFTLTATISFGTTVCDNSASVAFTNTCCTAVASAGQDISYCSGGTTVLGATAEPGMTYQWTPSTGLSDANSAQPIVTTTNTGTAPITTTYTLTVTNVTDGGCTDADDVTVTILPNPTVSAGTYSPVCEDAPLVALIGTPVGGTFTGTGVSGSNFNPAAGTQTLMYNYTDANGCVGSATATITVHPLPVINAGVDVTICEGQSVTLSGSGGATYQWTGGVTNNIAFTPGLGSLNYIVTGTDANGCIGSDEVSVTVVVPPLASVSADVQVGYPVLDVDFTNNSTNALSYFWIFGNSQGLQITTLDGQSMSYSGLGTYVVELTASNGICSDSDTLHILVIPFPDPIIYVPNVFTPNGDGVNEVWTIDTEWVSEMNILILNRWGNQVAEINGLTDTWNGKSKGNEVTDGVYFYSYRVVGMNGKELLGHGSFTLIR